MNTGHSDAKISRPRWWLRGLGLVWLIGFLWWFYSFTLPNARFLGGTPVSRTDIWILLPDFLWANISGNPNPGAPPAGWRFLPQRFDLIGVAGLILSAAWGLGSLALRVLRICRDFDRLTRTAFTLALGLSGLSLITLACGLAGLLHRPLLVGILVSLIAAEIVWRMRAPGRTSRSVSSIDSNQPPQAWWQRRWDVLPGLCLIVVGPFVLAMLLGAMLPPLDFDVKEYHLEGPKEYFQQGRVTFLSHNVYTSFPFLTEMLSLLAMVVRDDWFRGALAGKLVLMSMAPLTAVGLFAAGRRWFGSTVGWLCVVTYLTTPWVYRISIIAYADGGLTFLLFMTLLAVMWLVSQGSGGRGHESVSWKPGHLVLCGLLAGSAVACKYPGVLSVAIPLGGFLLVVAWRQSTRAKSDESALSGPSDRAAFPQRVRVVAVTAGWFTLGTLATFGPWMAKNVAETGNPVYPLLYGVFGGHDWGAAAHRKWQDAHPPMILRFVETPWTAPGNLIDRITDVAARSDWQSPLLFGCAPLALCWHSRRRLVWGLWVYVGWLFLAWWALTHHIDRFWVPMLPVVALLAGVGLGWLVGAADDLGAIGTRRQQVGSVVIAMLAAVLIGAAALFNLGYVTSPMSGYNAYLTDLNAAKREATTRSIAFLNEHLPKNARVLIVGGAEVFDADFHYVYNTVFDESLFERWTSAAEPGVPAAEQPLRPAVEILETFRRHGITHVFVDWKEILRYRAPGSYGFTNYVSPARFQDLVAEQVLKPAALDVRAWKDVDPSTRAEVEQWGPRLHLQSDGAEALLQYELFEVP